MKQLMLLLLFLGFLLIRSGNSHELPLTTARPTVSFMNHQELPAAASSHKHIRQNQYHETSGNGMSGSENQLLLDHESDDFQLWKDYHLQMALFAGLICFYFLRLLPDSLTQDNPGFQTVIYSQPLFISQRSLRI